MKRWDDVPVALRRRDPRMYVGGCAYAVPIKDWRERERFGEGYRQCANTPQSDSDACFNHMEQAAPDPEKAAMARVRSPISWQLQTVGLGRFRVMSDDEVLDMRNVGVKTAATIMHIRDTWSDDEIVKFARFDPRTQPDRLRPAPFESFSALDVCAYVGE
jgi:hypothetical protein